MNRYLVKLIRRPQWDATLVPVHVAFLVQLPVEARRESSGPFGDQAGGACLLQASDHADAVAISRLDPASRSGGWDITVHEWQAR